MQQQQRQRQGWQAVCLRIHTDPWVLLLLRGQLTGPGLHIEVSMWEGCSQTAVMAAILVSLGHQQQQQLWCTLQRDGTIVLLLL
jgi:hypothetical protein